MQSVDTLAKRARSAAIELAALPRETKDAVLLDLAERIELSAARIAEANGLDVAAARDAGTGDAKLTRLTLSDSAIRQMADGLRHVAKLDDPVGAVTKQYVVPSGLQVRKVRCPLGVIMMIYEARPNVTVDAFALCFKSGNACILKGGREATRSNALLAELAGEALRSQGAPPNAITLICSSNREELKRLLSLEQYIDLVIPRGGTALIRFVHEHARIPTVQHFHGVCHIFVDESADQERALEICATAKTSAPATCNAAECVLIHGAIAPGFTPALVNRLISDGVEVRGDPEVCRMAPEVVPAAADDWGREFLDLVLAVRVVPDIDAAIEHINTYGSNHTEVILSNDPAHQREFTDRIQSSCVLVNASTRFNDGFQLGLGAEIGISTSKIHAYGPMGLEELTTQRYVVQGNWQTR